MILCTKLIVYDIGERKHSWLMDVYSVHAGISRVRPFGLHAEGPALDQILISEDIWDLFSRGTDTLPKSLYSS